MTQFWILTMAIGCFLWGVFRLSVGLRVRWEPRLLRVFCDGAGECAYVAFRVAGPQLQVEFPSDWHEHRRAWVRVSPGLCVIAFSFPWWGKVVPDDGQCSGPTYGFGFHDQMLWLYTGKSTSHKHAWVTVPLPWMYKHVRHTYLNQDGSVHHNAGPHEYDAPPESKATHEYVYVRGNGEVQRRKATVYGEEHEYRLHYAPWLPWPRQRFRSISVTFDDEVGERTGSWKGGCIACGWDWRRGESQENTLRRMERERKF